MPFVSSALYNLALETAGPVGSVTLGRDDRIIASRRGPQQRRMDLMPTIDAVLKAHKVTPRQLSEVYISVGPGSFTGLRVGIATAKMFSRALGAKLVGVPSIDIVAQNAPEDVRDHHLAVCLNLKRGTVYAGLFEHDGSAWRRSGEPQLWAIGDLLAQAPRPLAILGDPLPAIPDDADMDQVSILPAEAAIASSEHTWRLGREIARRHEYTPELQLLPLYVRPPEAVTLWEARKESSKTAKQ